LFETTPALVSIMRYRVPKFVVCGSNHRSMAGDGVALTSAGGRCVAGGDVVAGVPLCGFAATG
jgi:hypothetical protein